MQIVTQVALSESDIKEAILAHIAAKGISTLGSAYVELVHGDSLSAKVDISSDASTGAATTPKNTTQKVEDTDREALKTELDNLGIAYAPKARTATLQDLLETARASSGTEEGTSPVFDDQAAKTEPEDTAPEDTGSMFGGNAEQEKEDPPFDTEAIKEPETDTASGEDSEDDRPLFGS